VTGQSPPSPISLSSSASSSTRSTEAPSRSEPATSANPLQIGGDSLFGQYFSGTIDEVRVYSSALSAAQVQADMATAISP
jgi:hypothetical protein